MLVLCFMEPCFLAVQVLSLYVFVEKVFYSNISRVKTSFQSFARRYHYACKDVECGVALLPLKYMPSLNFFSNYSIDQSMDAVKFSIEGHMSFNPWEGCCLGLYGVILYGVCHLLYQVKKRRKDAEEPAKYMGCGDCENFSHSLTVATQHYIVNFSFKSYANLCASCT